MQKNLKNNPAEYGKMQQGTHQTSLTRKELTMEIIGYISQAVIKTLG